jgi:hypothetical protein
VPSTHTFLLLLLSTPVRLMCVYSPAHLLDYIYLIEKDLYFDKELGRSLLCPVFDSLPLRHAPHVFLFYYFPPSCGLIIITVTVRIDFGRVASTTS